MIGQPAILQAAEAANLFEAALYYAALGFSVLPLRGKKPALLNWHERQERRADTALIERWDRAGLLDNIGIVCGQVSGNLAVVDLDGDDAIIAFYSQFPDLLNTYTVATGSGHGAHLYFRCDELPPTTRAMNTPYGNVELRTNGCYVVAPPSLHPDTGKMYVVSNASDLLHIHSLYHVGAWACGLKQSEEPQPARSAEPVRAATPWAQAALNAECTAVRFAPENSRNNTLNRAAFKLGQLVQRGLLSRSEVEAALFDAAKHLSATDGEAATRKTIKSGLEAGLRKPVWRGGA